MLGLIVTIAVMHHFKAAQPALLYLVPACLGASFLTAVAMGEWKTLLAFEEEDPDEKRNKNKEDAAEATTKKKKKN